MKYLYIKLNHCHQNDKFKEMIFAMEPHSRAERYCELIKESTIKNHPVRWVSWGMYADQKRLADLVTVLNADIRSFNQRNDLNLSVPYASDHPDRAELNHIHSLFEAYLHRYQQEKNRENADYNYLIELCDYLNNINQGVHALEAVVEMPDDDDSTGWFTFTLGAEDHSPPQVELEDEDYDHFTLEKAFGDVFLGYATAGKNLFHMMVDDDFELIQKGGKASPQQIISTNTMCVFSSSVAHEDAFSRFEKWFNKNELEKYGYDLQSKYNSIGYLKIGHFIRPKTLKEKSEKEIVAYYSEHSKVSKIRVIEYDSVPKYFQESENKKDAAYWLAKTGESKRTQLWHRLKHLVGYR